MQANRTTLTAIILASGMILAGAVNIALGQWCFTDPEPVHANAGTDSGDDWDPAIVTDGLGTWLAIWHSLDDLGGSIGSDRDILIARSTDEGMSWTVQEPLNNNAAFDTGDDVTIQVATDGLGSWVAVWASTENVGGTIGTDYDILCARSTDDGETWTDPQPLNSYAALDGADPDFRPLVVTDGQGNWLTVWFSSHDFGPDHDIFVARSTDAGVSWSPAMVLNSNAASDSGEDWAPRLATDGLGNWVVVWFSEDDLGGSIGEDHDILVSRSTDNGTSWTPVAALNTNAETDSGFDRWAKIATDGLGNWTVVWASYDDLGGTIGIDADVLVSRSTDAGTTWTAPAALNTTASSDTGDDLVPMVITDTQGNWVTVWTSLDDLGGKIGTDRDLLISRSTDNGATWTVPEPLNNNAAFDTGEDTLAAFTTDGLDNWVVVWDSTDNLGGSIGTDDDILYTRFRLEETVLYVDENATGPTHDGSSWCNAYLTFHEALSVAMLGSTIRVADGTYKPDTSGLGDPREATFQLLDCVTIEGGYAGCGAADPDLRDVDGTVSVLSGDIGATGFAADNCYHVVTGSGCNRTAVLDGFTITEGNADGIVDDQHFGGGMWIDSGAPTLVDCTFSGNSADDSGGAIRTWNSGMTLTSCDFVGNAAPLGGGIFSHTGRPTLIDCTFSGNAANAGGAMHNVENILVLANCSFDSNSAAWGGAMYNNRAVTRLAYCTFIGNAATSAGGGILCTSGPGGVLDTVTLDGNTAPYGGNGIILDSVADVRGTLFVADGALWILSSTLDASTNGEPPVIVGTLELGPDSELAIGGTELGAPPSRLLTNIEGGGDINVDLGQALQLTGDVDLVGSANPADGCDNPAATAQWGNILLRGEMLLSGTLRHANIQIDDDVSISESCGYGVGGKLFSWSDSTVEDNKIISYSDRYMEFDPETAQVLFADNCLTVVITEDIAAAGQGKLFELRMEDVDCYEPPCEWTPGTFIPPTTHGFQQVWALDRLEVEANARVNLSNRQNFVQPLPPVPETVYVKDLILRENAVLNTAFARLYYQTRTMEAGSKIVDLPLLGFSLGVIEMEDDCEFDVRVCRRPRNPDDPLVEGSVTREEGLMPPASTNGVMDMQTRQAPSVAACGSFARASEDEVVVMFEYLFRENPQAKLVVYLSDDPEVDQSRVELAQIVPPAPGAAGSLTSDEFATFYGTFPRGSLNFTRGTYVELELRRPNSRVWIDRWDPQIECLTCLDLNGTTTVDNGDYLLVLAEFGQTTEPAPGDQRNLWCFDENALTADGYVDLGDLLAWDTFLNDAALDPCGGGGGTLRGPMDSVSTNGVILPPSEGLLVAGKPSGAGLQQDFLYSITINTNSLDNTDTNGACLISAQSPASVPGIDGYRGNGRLVRDGSGEFYQIHATQGLVRLSDGAKVLEPSSEPFGGDTIHVGVNETGGGDFVGLPLADVAFDPDDGTTLYVTPVVVQHPAGGSPAYRATAKLQLAGGGSFDVVRIYGVDPHTDSTVTISTNGTGDLVYEPDLQRLRELEIDDGGNLFVISAQAINDNDWILVYDVDTNAEQRYRISNTVTGPTALRLSPTGDHLYLASSLNELPNARTRVYRFDVQRSSGSVTGVVFNGSIDIDNPTDNDQGYGHAAAITSLELHPTCGTLYATGFTTPRFAADASPTSTWFDPQIGSILATATLAVIPAPATATGPVTARTIRCESLSLPIAAVYVSGFPGDFDRDGDVDLDDYAVFADCMAGPGATPNPTSPCSVDDCLDAFDFDVDLDIDIADFAGFQNAFTG